ncbi:MAP7 domain-containing protein 3 [Discoglossus pictus]
MADNSGKLRGLREQMAAAAQALADERRSQSGTSPVPVQSPVSTKTAKPVIDASSLRTDERQRLARERREERERQNAAKESQILEKEKKAKLQYEKQMEEKQKKLEEQKQKEEQKRTAVEEKRKQKEMAEKERREANVRRTLERNSQLDQRQKRWSWGGSVEGDGQGNKRSTSTTNLKQTEIVISKRLSSSSATLQSSSDKSTKQRSSSLSRLNNKTALPSQQLSASPSNTDKKGGTDVKRSSSLGRLNAKRSPSPHLEAAKKEDKPAHRPQTNPLESSIISRLLIPTQSSLARSKSSTSVSADGKDSPESHLCPRSASATTISTPPSVSKGPMRSRSIDRLKSSQSSTSGASSTDVTQTPEQEKQLGPAMEKRPASPTQSGRRRSPSPLNLAKRPSSPTVENKRIQKTRSPSPSLLKQKAASPTVTHKPAPIQRPPLTGNILSSTKKNAEAESKPKEKAEEKTCSETKSVSTSEKETPAAKTKDDTSSKTISGSTTAEEAAKILAEKRRFAREQREREEQERIRREEEEKIKKEEMARKAVEEAARQKIEAQRLEEERKIMEEEEQQKAQEEKIRREIEEQERLVELQQQKEEAEARALEEAEKQKLEREKIMQQNMKERLERKRRINEIMKRTRKTDQLKNDECAEEDDEMNNLDTNILEKVNGVDFCDGTDDPEEESPVTTPELISTESLFPSDSVLEQNKLIINGDKPNTEEKRNGPSETTQVEESSPVANQDHLQFNDDDNTTDLIQNLNGKSNTWTFEEYIDLGIHSKSTSLSPDSITADNCHQDLIEGSLPAAPKLAFDEGRANSLSKPIEPAAEM